MITLHTIASGSEGNSLIITADEAAILIDAGISTKRITNALSEIGLTPDQLSAVLITHEHADHIQGLKTFVKKYSVPIYASIGTAERLTEKIPGILPCLRPLPPGSEFTLENARVKMFRTSHDSAESVDYTIKTPDGAFAGILTDTGFVTPQAKEALLGCQLIVLEANHDPEWLINGSYPYLLQQRILSDYGHLSNQTAGEYAVELARNGTKEFILAHLSKENNTPIRALTTVQHSLERAGFHLPVTVPPRGELSRAYTITMKETSC